MFLLIIFSPLIGFVISLFFGRFITPKGSAFITSFCIFFSFLLSLIGFYEIGFCKCPVYIRLFPWIDIELLDASWGFLFDSLTISMCLLVSFISFLVHLYSTSYMNHDPHQPRFMSYLSLFTFFMFMLISSDNFLQLFFGWEGVGLCSYLLINFWFTRLQANKSAIKAMIVNRIGDFFLTLGILCVFIAFKSLNFVVIFSLLSYDTSYSFTFLNTSINIINCISLFLFIGAMGKSAQLGLHTWLPDAMEGPTPVSALIHAATMVTAGVFLIIRCSFLYEYSTNILFIVSLVGVLTSFFAGTIGVFQNDLKKIIAYSTCSQLGYMIFACGLSNYSVSIFHVLNHAYFKALLFLSAGSVIHSLLDEQDIRRMGGLQKLLPFTYLTTLIGSLALTGFPFLTGFYSKDLILEMTYAKYNLISLFSFWIGSISASITAFYSFKLLYMVFLSNVNAYKLSIELANETSYSMSLSLFLLSICSIFLGFFTKDIFVGFGTPFWNNSIFVLSSNLSSMDCDFIPLFIKWIPFLFSLIGSIFSIVIYFICSGFFYDVYLENNSIRFLYTFFNKKWFFDRLQNETIVSFLLKLSFYFTYKIVDKGFLEIVGPKGICNSIFFLGRQVSLIQSGRINQYAFLIFAFVIFCVSFNILLLFCDFFVELQIYFLFLLCIFVINLD